MISELIGLSRIFFLKETTHLSKLVKK